MSKLQGVLLYHTSYTLLSETVIAGPIESLVLLRRFFISSYCIGTSVKDVKIFSVSSFHTCGM
jgi:hypothetical protein